MRRTLSVFNKRRANPGFALPTVIIISIVTLTALITTMSVVTVTRAALSDQYYSKLAREAALSGVERATACVKSNYNVANWSDEGRTLSPSSACDGTPISGASQYVVDSGLTRTTFSVGSVDTSAGYLTINAEGTTDLLRKSDGASWRQYKITLNRKVSIGELVATSSAIGIAQVCGILDAKTWCWGMNQDGQLGNGTTDNTSVPVMVRRDLGVLSGKIDTHIAIGFYFGCSISSNEVYCWGRNDYGQLGNGTTTPSLVPIKIDHSTGLAGKTLTAIALTESTACVIASGDVYCWGRSKFGELGIGVSSTTRTRPVRVSTIGASNGLPVTQLATTPYARHICAVANDRAYCWGGNRGGELGINSSAASSVPVAVHTNTGIGTNPITSLAVGGYDYDNTYWGHTCAVAGGNVYCWGVNTEYQSNPSTSDYIRTPLRMTSTLPAGEMLDVGVGYDFTCARATGSRVWCWGDNYWGQTGNGNPANTDIRYPTPLVIAGTPLEGRTMDKLIGGAARTCVLSSGRSYCWGRNDIGQLGNGNKDSTGLPVEATFLRNNAPNITF